MTTDMFCPSTPVPPTNTIDRHDITEILLKAALNTTNLNLKSSPLKLLNQIKPNLAGMVLKWSLSKLCPTTPHSIQDGGCY